MPEVATHIPTSKRQMKSNSSGFVEGNVRMWVAHPALGCLQHVCPRALAIFKAMAGAVCPGGSKPVCLSAANSPCPEHPKAEA